MYICICGNINEKRLNQEIDKNRCSTHELCQKLGLGNKCGQCLDNAKKLIEKKVSELQRDPINIAEETLSSAN